MRKKKKRRSRPRGYLCPVIPMQKYLSPQSFYIICRETCGLIRWKALLTRSISSQERERERQKVYICSSSNLTMCTYTHSIAPQTRCNLAQLTGRVEQSPLYILYSHLSLSLSLSDLRSPTTLYIHTSTDTQLLLSLDLQRMI